MSKPQPVVLHESDCAVEGATQTSPGAVRWRTLLSADRTPSHGLTLGVAEIDPGKTESLGLHHHAQAEAYYVLSGEGVVHIDGKTHPVRSGSSVFLPGDVVHCAANTGSEPLRILYVFPTDSFSEVKYEFPDD